MVSHAVFEGGGLATPGPLFLDRWEHAEAGFVDKHRGGVAFTRTFGDRRLRLVGVGHLERPAASRGLSTASNTSCKFVCFIRPSLA